MTIRRNDPPGDAVITNWQRAERGNEHVRIARMGSDSQLHHASVASRQSDLTQLGDHRFTENETDCIRCAREPRISRGSGAQQPGVQNRGDSGRRDRQAETGEKKGRPH